MAVSESVDTGNRVCHRIDHGHPERWTCGGERQSDAGAAWCGTALPFPRPSTIISWGWSFVKPRCRAPGIECNSRFWERWLCKGEQSRGGALRAGKGWSDALSAVSAAANHDVAGRWDWWYSGRWIALGADYSSPYSSGHAFGVQQAAKRPQSGGGGAKPVGDPVYVG